MSSKESSFVVIICHGSYHTPEPYQPFIIALRAQGIEAYCPQLPSSDLLKLDIGDPSNPDYSRAPPPNGHPQPSDDAVIITELLHQLVTESGKQVLLIGHSSGAFTATMVAVPELHAKTRKASGAPGGIVGIFYECGFLIPPGESVHRFFQPKDGSDAIIPPYCHFHGQLTGCQKHGFRGLGSATSGATYFFNGLDPAAARYYEATLTASPVFTTVLTNDAYTALPCAYLVTEDDLALPAAYQEEMVAMQKAREGVEMRVFRCGAGHSPHLTWMEGMVEKVLEFGGEVSG